MSSLKRGIFSFKLAMWRHRIGTRILFAPFKRVFPNLGSYVGPCLGSSNDSCAAGYTRHINIAGTYPYGPFKNQGFILEFQNLGVSKGVPCPDQTPSWHIPASLLQQFTGDRPVPLKI